MPGLDLTLDLDLGLRGNRKPRRQPEQLPPAQQQSLVSKVGNTALGGLAAVGGVLDLPGSSVRDLIAGENPFDQYLSPFDPNKNRVTGRDLLRKSGMIGSKDTWGNWAGGLAAEIALDPTTYIGIGALGKAGQFAKGAGVLDDVTKVAAKKTGRALGQMGHREARIATTVDDLMQHGGDEVVQKLTSHAQRTGANLADIGKQKLGGMFGLNLPFADPFAVIGTGKTAEKVARGMDTAGRAIRYAKIPGTNFQPVNSVANLFDRAGEGMKTPEGRARQQELLRSQEANRAATRAVEAQLAVALEKAGLGTQDSAKFVRQVMEDPRTVSEATRLKLKKAIQDVGALPDDQQAEAVSQLYKAWAEGYFGEDLASTLQRTMDPQFAVKDAPLPTGHLPQVEWKKGQPPPIKGDGELEPNWPYAPTLDELAGDGPRVKQATDVRPFELAPDDPEDMLTPSGQFGSQIVPGLASTPRQAAELAAAKTGTIDSQPVAQQKLEVRQPAGLSETTLPGMNTPPRTLNAPAKGSPRWLEQADNAVLEQLSKQGSPNAAVMFKENGKALLHTFTGKTNVTSHVHEFGHIARRHLKEADQAIANAFVGAKDANWTVDQEEKFARGLERYLRDGHASSPALKSLFAQIKQWMLDTYRALRGSPLAVKLTPEIKGLYGKLLDSPSKLPMSPAALQGLPPEVLNIVGKAHKLKDDALSIAQEMGVGPKRLKDPEIAHFPRFLSAGLRNAGAVGGGMPFSTESPSRQSRKLMYEGIKGGTATLQTIAQDPGLNKLIDGGASKKDIAKYIKNTFGQDVPEKFLDARTRKELRKAGTTEFTPQVVQQFGRNRYKALASNLSNMSPETRKSGIFGNHPLADLQTSTLGLKNAASAAKQTFDFLAQPGTLKPASDAARNVDTVKVGSVFKRLGIEKAAGLRQLAERTGLSADDLADMRVDKAQAQDLLTTRKGFDSPADPGAIMQAVDSATNFTKGMFTGPWPAFHVRNLTSGQTQNALAGIFSPDSVKDAGSLLFGKPVANAASIPILKQMAAERGIQSLDDTKATELLRELAYAHGIAGKHEGLGSATAGKAAGLKGTSIEDILGGQPGHRPFSFANVARKAAGRAPGTNLKPWDMRGVGGRLESGFGPMAAAEDMGYLVEGFNRLAPFIEQLRRGIEPAEAAKRIGEVQVSYSNRNFTKFELEAMARLFPFYKFSRKQLGHTAAELASKPGGRLAQGIRAVNRSRGPNELTPDYVADTASIPLGENEDGSKRYITGLGLAPEDPLSFMQADPQAVGLEALSRLNPMLKGPLEYATGQSFFQRGQNGGRPLDDLDPTLGRILANVTGRDKSVTFPGSQAVETALSNSPLARALTTTRTATDRRKGWGTKASQILTGVRVSDISPAAQDAVLRDRMAEIERELGSKTFVKRYFPKEILEEMTPEQREQAEQINALRKMLEQRAKERGRDKDKKKS